MRIAVTYGPMCLQRSAEETWNDPRTGSEIGWRRIVEGLRARGHEAFQVASDFTPLTSYDAVISINEPDALRKYTGGVLREPKLRICMFWLNGFSFCKEGFDDHVDLYFSPSEAHRQKAIGEWGAPKPEKWGVNYLGSDAIYDGMASRVAGRAVYCSSPDRGLHRVLESWPRIKRAAPNASLRIFYRLQPWIDELKATPYYPPIERNRSRALYIEEALKRLSGPEWGITVVDSVSHEEVLAEMRQAEVLLHPCETMSWSEGFSVTTIDACASGCAPVISDCDALGEVFADIDPVPVGQWDKWRDRVILTLTDDAFRAETVKKATAIAERLTWSAHVERLDATIRKHIRGVEREPGSDLAHRQQPLMETVMVDSKTSGVVIKPSPAFVNAAGSITNIAFGEFTCISLIHSVGGAYRSRHWHSTDSHVLYVLRGEMWYQERTLDGEYPGEWTKVLPGESVFTPPLVVHQTFFPRDTMLISASKNRRDHESHEADVQRVEEPWQITGR